MRWRNQRESSNIEDRRGMSIPGGAGGMGVGTIVVVLLAAWFFGVDPATLLGMLPEMDAPGASSGPVEQGTQGAPTDDGGRFAAVILASTEDVWSSIFRQSGAAYQPPRLVLSEERVDTACGLAGSATGPFYCPGDQRLYIDLGFFRVFSDRLGAAGNFAQTYVIAHEVGHHVQNLQGTMRQLNAARCSLSQTQYNALPVRVELQADCYAGVWAQRVQWFRAGLDSGDPQACDTFTSCS